MSGSNYQQNNKKNWNHATPWVRLLNNSQGVANVPIGRHWHTGNICQGYDGSQYFIIFGGYSTNAQTGHSDVWSLGLDMFNIWSEIQHKNSSSARSTARYSHTAAVLNDRQLNPDPPGVCNIYVFGGTTRSQTTLRQKDEEEEEEEGASSGSPATATAQAHFVFILVTMLMMELICCV